MSQKDDRGLDSPTPPGGPMRRDEPTEATEEVQPDAPDPEVEPPGEHGSHLTDEHDRGDTPEAQEQNAESSLDQPSQ